MWQIPEQEKAHSWENQDEDSIRQITSLLTAKTEPA
jgi:hypothetical protein